MTSVGVMASSVVSAGTDVLFEPFNNYTAAPWTTGATSGIVAGRTGTAHNVSSSGGQATYAIPAINQGTTLLVGFAFRWTDAATTTRDICQFRSGGAASIENALSLVTSTGQLQFKRGATTTIASSATGQMVANTWYYLEVRCFLDDTAGTVVVRINGSDVINAGSLDTHATANPVCDAVRLGAGVASISQSYDDLYITTGAGATFKGNITIP